MSVRTRASSPGGTLIQSGILAARPVAGIADRYYWATDVYVLFRDTGAAWEKVGGMRYALYLYDAFAGFYEQLPGWSPGLVSIVPIQITETVTVDRIICIGDDPDQSLRMAIYADNGFTPVGGALIVESASVAAIVGKNELPIANTRLTPGLYWLAQQRNGWMPYLSYQGQPPQGGTVTGHGFDLAYGAFPNPCPATVLLPGPIVKWVRVASIP